MILTRTNTYAVCPSCGADAGQVDHLLGRNVETLWYCDACGQRYRLVFHASGSVDISIAKGRKITTVDLLVLKPQTQPVYFIVHGMRFVDEMTVADKLRDATLQLTGDAPTGQVSDVTAAEEHDRKQFYYEEHSCPTNWLKPEKVYFDGDNDPHGLIEFVAWADDAEFPLDENHGPNDRDFALDSFVETEIAKAEGRS